MCLKRPTQWNFYVIHVSTLCKIIKLNIWFLPNQKLIILKNVKSNSKTGNPNFICKFNIWTAFVRNNVVPHFCLLKSINVLLLNHGLICCCAVIDDDLFSCWLSVKLTISSREVFKFRLPEEILFFSLANCLVLFLEINQQNGLLMMRCFVHRGSLLRTYWNMVDS